MSLGNMSSVAVRVGVLLALTGLIAAVVAFPEPALPWVKALHVIAVISWMAGLLYLPRLFVYHCDCENESAQDETFKLMERRLLQIIMTPAMAVTWVSGLWLVWQTQAWTSGWFLVKFAAVFLLSGVQGHFSKSVRAFAAGSNQKSARHWRIMNEVPTVLMIIIVIMVIVRPF